MSTDNTAVGASLSRDVLAHLGDVVAQRRAEGDPDKSYVAKLFAKGLDQILKKVGEEATEVVIAAILDRPDSGYGGLVAAPLFRSVARAAITRLGIAPTEPLPLPPHALPVG